MNLDLGTWGPATVLVIALTLIAAIGGIAVVLFGDQLGGDSLTFNEYLDTMSKFVIGVGILGVGRAIYKRPPEQ